MDVNFFFCRLILNSVLPVDLFRNYFVGVFVLVGRFPCTGCKGAS